MTRRSLRDLEPLDRLPQAERLRLRELLKKSGVQLCGAAEADLKLEQLRRMYEPYISALADRLVMPLPPWTVAEKSVDNWRTSAWGGVVALGAVSHPLIKEEDEHF